MFLVHHSHLDIGYTDLQPAVLRHHRAYLDSVLDLAAATDGWPDDARFRWNVESNLPLRRWLEERPPARVAELVERVREGRIEVCALPFTSNVEACAVEELALQLGWARSFAEKHGVEVVTAMQTDVPGHGHGLPRLLAAAGVRYLDVAHNYATRAAPHLTGGFDLPRLFRWGGRDGVARLAHGQPPRRRLSRGQPARPRRLRRRRRGAPARVPRGARRSRLPLRQGGGGARYPA